LLELPKPGLKVDGKDRIVHPDRQDRYDGDISNSLSRGSFVRKNDNHNQIRIQSNCLTKLVNHHVINLPLTRGDAQFHQA
jgi:hypothetical protein